MGTKLARFDVFDADSDTLGQVSFRLEQNTSHPIFHIDPNTGIFRFLAEKFKFICNFHNTGDLSLSQPISPEMGDDMLNITVVALDGGRPGLNDYLYVFFYKTMVLGSIEY